MLKIRKQLFRSLTFYQFEKPIKKHSNRQFSKKKRINRNIRRKITRGGKFVKFPREKFDRDGSNWRVGGTHWPRAATTRANFRLVSILA